MNKQELINKLNKILTSTTPEIEGSDFDIAYNYAIKRAILLAEDLDEQVRPPEPKPLELEKPVVPQFVAEWYEKNKDGLGWNLYTLCVDFYKRKLPDNLHNWFKYDDNKPIETLVKMKLFGYEIEKEKLYTVEIPNPNHEERPILFKKRDGKVHIIFPSVPCWRTVKNAQLTESEIKKDFEWAWKFAEEV